jgi:Ca2+-binding EF-hand superfamily protein
MRGFAAIALLALPAAALAQSHPATPSAYLDMLDANGDGRVSLSEYQDYMSAGFRSMDANGDGVLDATELPPGPRSAHPLTLVQHRRHLAATFHRQDADGDGYLSARELAAPPR